MLNKKRNSLLTFIFLEHFFLPIVFSSRPKRSMSPIVDTPCGQICLNSQRPTIQQEISFRKQQLLPVTKLIACDLQDVRVTRFKNGEHRHLKVTTARGYQVRCFHRRSGAQGFWKAWRSIQFRIDEQWGNCWTPKPIWNGRNEGYGEFHGTQACIYRIS